MLPAHERLERREPSLGERHDRLVVQHELAPLERVVQVGLGASRRCFACWFISGSKTSHTRRAVALGAVHGRDRVAQEVLGPVRGRRASAIPIEPWAKTS